MGISENILVFDIGGHGIRAALFEPCTGRAIRQADLPAERRDEVDALHAFTALLASATAAVSGEDAGKVVIAVPGPVLEGKVEQLPTLYPSNLALLDLAAIGQGLWPEAEFWAANDITAAGYAFVDRGFADFCVFTCGSGIGGKIFVDGNPLLGSRGLGGEFGHWRVPGAPDIRCDCGGRGHLGAIASGRGVVRLAQRRAGEDPSGFGDSSLVLDCSVPERFTTSTLVKHALSGDNWSLGVIDQAAQALGETLALIHLSSGTDKFFVTGGFGTSMGPRFGHMIALHAQRASAFSGLDWDAAISIADPNIEHGLEGAAAMTKYAEPLRRMASQCG